MVHAPRLAVLTGSKTGPRCLCIRHYSARSTPTTESSEQLAKEKAFDEEWDRLQAGERPEINGQTPTGAAYLLEQALQEEAADEAKRKDLVIPELREQAWEYGPHAEEPQVRALRRILEDQYKPLRIKGYKKPIPKPAPLESRLFAPPPSSSSADASEGKPREVWDYTFKSPNDGYASIRTGVPLPSGTTFSPSSSRVGGGGSRTQRLASALEKSWDYNSGFRNGTGASVDGAGGDAASAKVANRRPMGGVRAWTQLVEDKIEEARQDGMFKNLSGRGKPLPRDENESNPFISRDDFLINRIVQGQGAAPPWVELQIELDQELTNFRQSLLANWQRRTLRVLSLGGVSRTALKSVESDTHRDPEWEDRERSYHDLSVTNLNSIVRRYNGIAPYAVRRAPIRLDLELAKCFRDSRKPIMEELQRRLDGRPREGEGLRVVAVEKSNLVGQKAEKEEKAVDESMWTGFKRLVRQWTGSEPGLMADSSRR